MMYWDGGNGFGFWGWVGMGLGMIVFWGALAVAGVALYQTWNRRRAVPAPIETPDAERILTERFACGEIDEAEFRQRLEVLRAHR